MVDYEKEIDKAIYDGIRSGVNKLICDQYNSPLTKVVNEAITANHSKFRKLIEESIAGCLVDEDFTNSIKTAIRGQLAKTLVHRFGGELEKQVNALKSDPTTRARIVIALEQIVSTQADKV